MVNSLLRANDLSIGFKENLLFRSINIEESAGNIIALIGSNGRGKSTLLKTLANLEKQIDGDITINGENINNLSSRRLSELITFVSPVSERVQYLKVEDMLSINCYHRTNWIGSLNEEEKNKIKSALKLVGLDGFATRNCNSLSDGEFQRATIAGAIVLNSKIIMLDEPTAFLDVPNKLLITKLLRDIAHSKDKLIIFSTHDIKLAMDYCDRLWIMTPDNFYSGTPEELIKDNIPDKMFLERGIRFNPDEKNFIFG